MGLVAMVVELPFAKVIGKIKPTIVVPRVFKVDKYQVTRRLRAKDVAILELMEM